MQMFYKNYYSFLFIWTCLIFNPSTIVAQCYPISFQQLGCAGNFGTKANSSKVAHLVFLGLQIQNPNSFKLVCNISGRIAEKNGSQNGIDTPNCSAATVVIDAGAVVKMDDYAGIQCQTTYPGSADFGAVGKPTRTAPLLITCTNPESGAVLVNQLYSLFMQDLNQTIWACQPWS